MIVVTGAAGFIGSCLIGKLNREGYRDIVAVDDFTNSTKAPNLADKVITEKVPRSDFHEWLPRHEKLVQFVFHLGARTDTAEMNRQIFKELNLDYSKEIWQMCVDFGLPLIYASSGATYGLGEHGYADDPDLVPQLKPLNPYGQSKNDFDQWAINQEAQPYYWIGLKFFNVFGPNEYHKDRMASVVYHAFNQVIETGKVKLFRSHNPDFEDGEQMRDFIYIKDVVEVLYWLMLHRKAEHSGIYNLGTGQAETFLHLANSIFKALGQESNIEFVDTPEDIRDKYQYFTEAKMEKMRSIGYDQPYYSLEAGIKDYVLNYLKPGEYY